MLPDVTLTIKDPSLGILPDDTTADSAKIGVTSTGVANLIYSYAGASTQTLIDEQGTGPAVEATAHHLTKSGGKTVYLVPVTSSVAGTNSAITHTGGGPVVTIAGAPKDDYQASLVVVIGGALGAGTFKVSLDGGDNYSAEITIPSGGTYLIPGTGVTVTFPAGTYVAGDTYAWTSTAPSFSVSDMSAALDVLLADQTKAWGFVHIVGAGVDATAALAMATALGSKMDTAFALGRPAFALLELPAVDKALLTTGLAGFAHPRVAVVGGYEELVSDISARVYKRPAAWPVAARIAKVPISVDPSRNASDSDLEALAGVVTLVPRGAVAASGYHDEGATPGFDGARIISLRTILGRQGFYITNPNLMAASGSDFKWIMYRRVMDRACSITRTGMLAYLNKGLRTNPTTGFILELDAQGIENNLKAQLSAALVQAGHASAVSVVVNRADNLLTSPTLRVKVRITPKGYAKQVEVEMGFRNPALSLAS